MLCPGSYVVKAVILDTGVQYTQLPTQFKFHYSNGFIQLVVESVTIYGHGSHLGYRYPIISQNKKDLVPRISHIHLGYSWQSVF